MSVKEYAYTKNIKIRNVYNEIARGRIIVTFIAGPRGPMIDICDRANASYRYYQKGAGRPKKRKF